MKLLQTLSPRQRIAMGAGAAAVLLVAFLLFRLATAPSYTLLTSGLDPAKTGKMTAALDTAGIKYELRNNGTAIAVAKGTEPQAQVALAGKGLSVANTGDQADYSLLDKQKMGASTFQQQIAYQRALEGEISNTISQVDGVPGAQVRLTMPKDQLFTDEAKPATAAVLLEGDSTELQPGAVKGIASIVANSVEGLKTDNVTITDSTGQLLWPAQDGQTTGGATAKQAAEARYAQSQESKISAMLATTLGPGKSEVQVNADLNVDKTTKAQLQYGKGVPSQTTKEDEKLKSTGAGSGATAGTTANIPAYANSGSGTGGKSNYTSKKGTTDWNNDKTVTNTEVAPGAVNKQSVSLILDKTIPAAQVAGIKNAVAAAAGLDRTRGDTISVTQVAFATQPATAKKPLVDATGLIGYAKYGLLGLASLLFLFFVTRHLRRREDEVLTEPTWLRQLDQPLPIAQLEAIEEPATPLEPGSNRTRQRIEETVNREPERVATALRTWMAEDEVREAQEADRV
jgi:flagellar M-ring protein FliF